ncbi:hypothetical protein CTEN210_08882 [Chaetoceros tenuissimus]|uniref:Cytochrome P450 n=1 Tax=Chaetoceros tenuissimus TaxID=426638 RepID=A0AAD3CUC0_9STRA|nr:hypothetical protein CTEN210_08882 [Chaetoceros tenuissimus]
MNREVGPILYKDVVTAVIALFLIGIFIQRKKLASNTKRKLPPLTKTTKWETIKLIAASDALWWIVSVWKELKCSVFRFNLLLPGIPMMAIVCEYELAREILIDPSTSKPRFIYQSFEYLTGGEESLFTSNAVAWHQRRVGMTSAFSAKHIKRMHTVALRMIDEWIETTLRPMVRNGEAFDVGKEMIRVILGAISETAFEYTISEEEKDMFAKEFSLCSNEFINNASNPWRKLYGLLIPERRRAFISAARIMNLGLNIVAHYRTIENPIEGTVIDCIMKNSFYKNDGERAADVIFLLIAGHDTTAYSISFTLKELSKNQREQDKLRESLKLVEKEKWSHSDALRNVVKEAIRLNPVTATGSCRCLGKDFTSREGYVLPKGSIIFTNFLITMRDPTVFEDADTFNPSRWENPSEAMKKAFLPFAIGKQNCLGQNLAMVQVHSIVAKLLSSFQVELVEEGVEQVQLTLRPIKTMLRAKAVE